MTKDFDRWLAQLVADDGGVVDSRWRQWLQATFEEWGPLSTADVTELAETERDRQQAVQLEDARRLLPAIVADGHAVGMTLDVVLTLRTGAFGGLEVASSPEPGSGYYSAANGVLRELFMTDGELLAWLADEVQEATMERDQVHCFVWPTCPVHQLGGHAVVDDGTAVWRCNGGGGHVLARIGELARRPA
jgi:hypothetical protein